MMISAAGLRKKLFGGNIKVEIQFDGDYDKDEAEVGRILYRDGKLESISGKVCTVFDEGKIIEHLGVKVELIGQIGECSIF